jgi:hypothetical protein
MNEKLKISVDSNRESIEKALPEITTLLRKNYESAVPMDQEGAFSSRNMLTTKIAEILKKNGVSIGADTLEIMAFFTKQKMSLSLSPIPV